MEGILGLNSSLFWDVNSEKIDLEKDAQFIIGRVLDFGDLKEWKAIKTYYGSSKIKESAQRHVFANPQSANFWSLILNLSAQKLKCTRKPSLKTPRAFLKR